MPESPTTLPCVCVVSPPDVGHERIDRFLATRIGTVSRTRVKTLILARCVERAGIPVTDPAEAVRPDTCYIVTLPPPPPLRLRPQTIPLAILYEDDELIVLDKPAGLVVHPAPGNPDGTLVNALVAHFGSALPARANTSRPGIVHRLDKDTSGVMVVAKTEYAESSLGTAFATRTIDRAYVALVWGIPAAASGEFSGPIGRDPRDRKRMAVRTQGKSALTRYRSLKSWFGAVTLIECHLGSGRTHQIRVHLAHAGHPLIGDPVYLRRTPAAARRLPPEVRALCVDFPRQALHATRLGFRHPVTGERLVFTTDPPPDFTALLSALDEAVDEKKGQHS